MVTMVKHMGERTTVVRTEPNGNHRHEVTLRDCPDPPDAAFTEALAAFGRDVLGRCKLGAVFTRNATVTGVTVSTTGQGHRIFKPSGKIATGYGDTGISFPLLREQVEDEASATTLSEVELRRVEALLAAAEAYATGQRVQLELPLDNDGTDG